MLVPYPYKVSQIISMFEVFISVFDSIDLYKSHTTTTNMKKEIELGCEELFKWIWEKNDMPEPFGHMKWHCEPDCYNNNLNIYPPYWFSWALEESGYGNDKHISIKEK